MSESAAVRGYCVPFAVDDVCSTRDCVRGAVGACRRQCRTCGRDWSRAGAEVRVLYRACERDPFGNADAARETDMPCLRARKNMPGCSMLRDFVAAGDRPIAHMYCLTEF